MRTGKVVLSAAAALAEILEAGVVGMKKVAIEYEIKKGGGSGEVPSDTAQRP